MNNTSVCCIIVTYNIGERFYRCFNSVYNQVNEVIIVDNASDEVTINVLKDLELKDRVKIVYNKENYGIAKALNIGVKYAIENKFEWVLTLDNDSKVTIDMVDSMLKTYEIAKKKEGLNLVSVFPTYIEENFEKESDEISSNSCNYGYKLIDESITSGNLIKTNIFNKVGFFEEKYFIDQVDTEFCLRLRSKNYKQILCDGAILVHSVGNPQKGKFLWIELTYSNHNATRRYYMMRNRLDVWNKYGSIFKDTIKKDKLACIKETVKIVIYEQNKVNKIKSIVRGIKDYKKNKFNILK